MSLFAQILIIELLWVARTAWRKGNVNEGKGKRLNK